MNKNNNYIKINENGIRNGIDFSGLCTIFHRQCFQMVDVLIAYAQRSLSGLNLHAMPYEPDQQKKEMSTGNSTPVKVRTHPCQNHIHAKK